MEKNHIVILQSLEIYYQTHPRLVGVYQTLVGQIYNLAQSPDGEVSRITLVPKTGKHRIYFHLDVFIVFISGRYKFPVAFW